MNNLTTTSRFIIALAALALIATYFLPAWKIQLWAPQYPEGLTMKIWLNDLSGDVKVINGLNHYIGMKTIEKEMFPEFTWLPFIVAFYILAGLLVSLVNRRRYLVVYVCLLIIGVIAAMTDFYWWGYDYGHNLNPDAAIVVPGMAYQPPLLGYKVLLNFTALSIPDIGGWIFTASGALIILTLAYEIWLTRRQKKQVLSNSAVVLLLAGSIGLFSFSSCGVEPRPVNFGKDACNHCKMTLMDKHFGAEVVTKKGKVYVFDDVGCLVSWSQTGEVKPDAIALWLVVDYNNPGNLTDATKAAYLQNPMFKSPMASNIAAFEKTSDVSKVKTELNGGQALTWNEVLNSVK